MKEQADISDFLGNKFLQDVVEKVGNANPANIQEVAASQISLLNQYYETVLSQSEKSFFWAKFFGIAGAILFLVIITYSIFNSIDTLTIVGSMGALLTEVISGIIFYLYAKTTEQLSEFHHKLTETQRFLLANSVCEGMNDTLKSEAKKDLVSIIANSYNNSKG